MKVGKVRTLSAYIDLRRRFIGCSEDIGSSVGSPDIFGAGCPGAPYVGSPVRLTWSTQYQSQTLELGLSQ